MKKWFSIQTFVVVLMLVYNFFVPIGGVFAAENTLLPPSNLAYQSSTPDDGKLTWSAVYGANGYKVYEIKDGQLITLGSTTGTSYSLNDLPEGSYRYVVSTLTSEGESGPSAPVSVEIVYPEMQAPATLTSSIRNGNDIVLSWGLSKYAQKYNVYQFSESGEKTLLSSTTGTTYTQVNASEGIYTYSVTAYNSLYGESPDATPVKVEVIYPSMEKPENLTFTITNGTDVNLKWQAVNYAKGYNIYQVYNGQLELIKTVTGTSVTFSNLPAGDYTYKVFSYSDRFGESPEGSEVSVTVGSIVMTPPSNVTYKIQNINDVVFNWDAVPYATGYRIYELINGEKTLKSTVTGTSVTYSKLAGGNYEYEIYSYSDRFGESEVGSKVSFSIDTVNIYPPQDFTYKIQNGNDIVLNWSSAENATNYKVYQNIDGQKVIKSTVTGTTVTYANMPAGNYQFEVYTNSTRFGESAEGAQVSFTLEQIYLSAPENAKYEVKNGNDITVSWDAVEYATNYKVYQIVDGKKILKTTVSNPTAVLTNIAEGDTQYEIYSYSSRFGESAEGTSVNVSIIYPTMVPPENISETATSPTAFKLNWSPVEYATSYKVYQIVDGQKVLKSTVTGTSVSYSNMQPGVYHYEIYSYSTRFGISQEGAPIEVILSGVALPAPENLTYSISNGNDITLKWNAVQYANGYKIYQLIDGEYVLNRSVTGTSAKIANLPEGEFNFVVKPYSTLLGESPNGAEIKGTIVFPIMEKPENLTQTITNGNDITLRWSGVTYANSYKVYQIIDGQKVLAKTATGTSTVFNDMPEGVYQYFVHSYSDRFGESPEGSTVEINLIAPIMQAPANLTKTIANGNDIVLKWSSSTYSQKYNIYQMVDGEKVLMKTVTGTSSTFTNMPEGNYQYVVHSFNDQFGESPKGSTVEFTLTWPIMQAPADLTKSIANGNDIILKWDASTFAKGYKVYQIVDGEKILKQTVAGTSIRFNNMPEGNYQYVVYSYSDRFGDSPEGSMLEFTLTWPIMQAPTVSGSVFNANNITLSWKAVQWANEYRVYKVNGDSKELIYKGTALNYKLYNLTEDTHSFEVTAYSNRFGESVSSEQFVQKIVYPIMEPPVASLILLSETSARISWDFVTYANGYNVYEVIDGKPVLLVEKLNNLSYEIQNLTYANHEYYVTSYSNSFGESKPSEIVIAKLIIDTEAPVTIINAPTQWVNQEQLITLEATDNEVGVEKTFYSLNDGPFQEGTSIPVSQEGINKISFYSVDNVGNVEDVKTEYIKIDKTAPATNINDIPAYSQSFTVQLTGKDELSGLAKTYYSINGTAYAEGTAFVVDKEGINQISYYSVDAAGNKEEVITKEINIDRTAPKTESDAPETWVNKGVTITLTAEDENSGVAKTYYSINGSAYIQGTSFLVDKEGFNQISFYSIDKAGNKEEVRTIEVKMDKTAPTVSASFEEEYGLGTNFTLSYDAQDNLSGIAAEVVILNGISYKKGDLITLDQPGEYKLSIRVTDVAGLSTVVEKTFTVYIPVNLDVLPKVIKGNQGIFTVKAILPEEYQSSLFDVSTITLNGVSAVVDNIGLQKQAEKGHFKFNREEFVWSTGEVKLELRGYLDNKYLVIGTAFVESKK
ncbi:hypothetical protein SAMN05877753_107105 [Bacillus oleivorans]|uniref:Fibronectin type-III domain-containing protein n=1 Tax=Bacillus oleivorans TaxID=1448271 RepID=A0A285D181_9BACI|nr:hypothetical protein [Bacillus oleivorans]SNX73519.1 hypothetical protein SAMN05877753_107105 [Bacillus oleivorans]